MARINAGSTLVNQYAPPFVVSDFVSTGWRLRWNDIILAFEAFDPDELVVDAGFDTIQRQLFNGVTNQQIFVVPWQVDPTLTQLFQRAALYVTINGLKQHTDTYTVSSTANATIITLDETIIGPDDIEVVGLQAGNGAFIELETTTGTGGASQDIGLTWFSPSEQTLIITINGLRLHTDEYSISSISPFTTTTVTITPAPLIADAIEIIGITTTGEVPSSPVDATNRGGTFGLFQGKRQIGEEQILDFYGLAEGTNISITLNAISPNDTFYTIDATQPTFQNLGTGTSIAVDDAVTDPLQLRVLKTKLTADTAEGGLTIAIDTADDDAISIVRNFGYVLTSDDDYDMDSTFIGERIVGLTNFTTTKTITLPPIADVRAGEKITIKDEIGGASGAFTVTVDTAGGELIDGAGSIVAINSAFGYITLYSNGLNYFIISGT